MNPNNRKLLLGWLYGATSGFFFAVFAWGVDAWLLAQAHATYPLIKFIPGLMLCSLAGGMAGWLTIRLNRHGIALVLWLLLTLFYSWLIIWLPLTLTPSLTILFDPKMASWLDYAVVADLLQYRIAALLIVGLASLFTGLLEINLIEHARNTPYGLAPAIIMLVPLIAFGFVGSVSDQMINVHLRESLEVIDNLLQFAIDNQGLEVPREIAREKHLSALNAVTDLDNLLQNSRQLTPISFDSALGMIDILVDFEGSIIKCTTIYSQPTNCIHVPQTP